MARLILSLDDQVLAEFNMSKERYTIGRLPDNDVRIDNPAVSGHHSLIINILIYLLCSDGLPDMVEDEDIHLTISTFNASLDVVGQQLVNLANGNGGRDNVSVMLTQVLEPFPAKRGLLAKLTSLFRS